MGLGVCRVRQVPGAWGQGTGAHKPGGSRPGVRPEVNCSERTSVKAGRRSLKWKGGLLPLSLSRICGVPQAGHRGCLGTAPSAALGSLVMCPQPVCFQASRDLTCTGSTSSQQGCCSTHARHSGQFCHGHPGWSPGHSEGWEHKL